MMNLKSLSSLEAFDKAEKIAHDSLWVACDQFSYVTGTVIHTDAGYVGRRQI